MYQMRGTRVSPMSLEEIAAKAIIFCNIFKLYDYAKVGDNYKRYDILIDSFFSYGIEINVMDDGQWHQETRDLTIGHCDPSQLMISVPERIYYQACSGDRVALEVIFHELGHLLLGHQPLLHFSNAKPSMIEDAEWQADSFAEIVLETIGLIKIEHVLNYHM